MIRTSEAEVKISDAQKSQQNIKEKTITPLQVSNSNVLSEIETTNIIDAETATISDILGSGDKFNESMVTLIAELDGQVGDMSSSIQKLQEYTLTEKILGVFSKTKSKEKREKRIRENSVSDNLTGILSTANNISVMLKEQESIIGEQLEIANDSLKNVMSERTQVKEQLSKVSSDIAVSLSDLKAMQTDIDLCKDAAQKAKLEEQMVIKQDKHNELVDSEKLLITQSQNYDRLAHTYTGFVDSLGAQRSNQIILIDKLETDTHHRAIQTEQYLASVKTNEQQIAAHTINRIGEHVDASMHEQMNAFKSVSENQFADMVENHKNHMDRLNRSTEQGQRAAEKFQERFSKVIEEHKNV